MSEDFRYNEPAQALEDSLEEVLESHQQEQEAEKEAAEVYVSALERIANGSFGDEVDTLAKAGGIKAASSALAEYRVRSILRDGVAARSALVSDFLNQVTDTNRT